MNKIGFIFERKKTKKNFYLVKEELKKLMSGLEEEEFILTPVEIIKVNQPHHSEDEEKPFRNSKLLINKEAITESFINERSIADACLQMQYVIEDKKSRVDEPEVITHYETTYSIDKDTVEADAGLLLPSELEISCKKLIQRSEIPGSYYSSRKSLHSGTFGIFQKCSKKPSTKKRLSDKNVFTFLQDYCKNKYLNPSFNLSDGIFMLGGRLHKIEIVWLNTSEERKYPYNLVVKKEDEVKHLVEVDSANYVSNNDSLNLNSRKFIKKTIPSSTMLPNYKKKHSVCHVSNQNTTCAEIKHYFDDLTFHVKKKYKIHNYLRGKLGFKTSMENISDLNINPNERTQKMKRTKEGKDRKYFCYIKDESKNLSSEGEEYQLYILTPVDIINVDQSHHFKDKEKYFKKSTLLGSKEEFTVAEYSGDRTSIDYVEHDACFQVNKDELSVVYSTFVDELEVITHYVTATNSLDENIEVDTRWGLVPLELEVCPKNLIQRPVMSDSYYFSGEASHTGSPRIFQEASDEKPSIKWLSEKYVFTCLQAHYKNKYSNAQFNLSDGIFMLQWQSHKIEIVWLNASEETGHPYDLLLKKEGEVKKLIEVESSNDVANSDSFIISRHKFITKINQLETEFPEHKEKYCIYYVFNTNNSSMSSPAALYKVVPLKNA